MFHFKDAGFDDVWVGCDDDNKSRMVSNSLLMSIIEEIEEIVLNACSLHATIYARKECVLISTHPSQ